jgi:hypothetical protein
MGIQRKIIVDACLNNIANHTMKSTVDQGCKLHIWTLMFKFAYVVFKVSVGILLPTARSKNFIFWFHFMKTEKKNYFNYICIYLCYETENSAQITVPILANMHCHACSILVL